MRRRPNPYRVLAHAIDVGDVHLAELLAQRLSGPPVGGNPLPAAAAAVERLMRFLALTHAPG